MSLPVRYKTVIRELTSAKALLAEWIEHLEGDQGPVARLMGEGMSQDEAELLVSTQLSSDLIVVSSQCSTLASVLQGSSD